MASDDEFEPKLGRMRGQAPRAPKSHRARVRHAVQRAGGVKKTPSGSRRMSAKYGRGAGIGRVLSGGRSQGARSRRVVVKARFVRLAGRGVRAATAHLKYLQRDGVTREGEKGMLYGRDADCIDASDFMARCEDDRHQFRFIVAPEDSLQYDDLKPLTRKIMTQMESDLDTRLDWVAVDHFNTGHPHTHIVVRGRDDTGKDLVIAREYLSTGLRERVQAQVSLDLGPRSDREITHALQKEVGQERFTAIDRTLLRDADAGGRVMAGHHDPVVSAARAGRLAKLEDLGLAEPEGEGRWRLSPDLEATLRALGERGDILKALHHTLKREGREAALPEARLHVDAQPSHPITGRVLERGLADEHSDRRYLIVEATDGRVHYLDIGQGEQAGAAPAGAIVTAMPRPPEVRAADRTIAGVAALHGGIYTPDLHLKSDPSATQAFAETHVRRLEAIRRATGGFEREPDGRFRIGPDYLAKALAYEQRESRRTPVKLEVLTRQPLSQQVRYPGPTWLDREGLAGRADGFGHTGFGGEARAALRLRQQWLIEEGLMPAGKAMSQAVVDGLRRRELTQAVSNLERETGLKYRPSVKGDHVEGRLRQMLELGSGKYAVVEHAREFALVPWRPVLEKHIGKTISGRVGEGDINWTIGRSHGRDME